MSNKEAPLRLIASETPEDVKEDKLVAATIGSEVLKQIDRVPWNLAYQSHFRYQ